MSTIKSPLELYREKIKEVQTLEEIKSAFENSFAVCIPEKFQNETKRVWKSDLFSKIWKVNPDVIITQTDLCELRYEAKAAHNQFLIIDKNGTKETSDEIFRIIESSEYAPSAFFFFSEKKDGVKGCYRAFFEQKKASSVYKANLLIDGDKLLLTVRTYIRKKEMTE
jgi:hypothetical protein